MADTRSDIPDYLPQIIAALKAVEVSDGMIEIYRRRWSALPYRAQTPPCPFCLFRAQTGSLQPIAEAVDGNRYLRCNHCGDEILVAGATREKPARPLHASTDYLSEFVEVLHRSRTPVEAIESFRSSWLDSSPVSPDLPCPFCFVRGRQRVMYLLLQSKEKGLEVFRCHECRGTIPVRSYP